MLTHNGVFTSWQNAEGCEETIQGEAYLLVRFSKVGGLGLLQEQPFTLLRSLTCQVFFSQSWEFWRLL